MQTGLISLLPSILVLLHCTLQVQPLPVAIPRPPPGSKVVIVVGGGKDGSTTSSNGLSQTMVSGDGVLTRERKSLFLPAESSQIKRQGHLSKQPDANKKEKPRLTKILPLSPRHVAEGAHDQLYRPRKNFEKGKMLPKEKRTGPGPHIMDFRPHQPDITDMQNNNGKLSLPVMGFAEGNNGLGTGLGMPRPTPMANKLNPYTNGVAASFPPGIDPYDGFMRYAAENLETPMPNFVDYQSLEHLYGSQHPLNPYHGKEPGNAQSSPYADNFGYNNGNGIETSNSPPPPHFGSEGPPGYGEGGGSPGINEGGGGGRFRAGNNALGGRPGGSRHNNPNTIAPNSYEHGIDHFHAPSPGLGSAPPRPRPPNTDSGLYEEEHGHRSPPFEPAEGPSPYTQNHHSAPFKHPNAAGVNPHSSLHEGGPPHSSPHSSLHEGGPPHSSPHSSLHEGGPPHSSPHSSLHDGGGPPHSSPHSPHIPEPADLDVYEEGPPSPGSHPPLPPPPQLGQTSSSHPDEGLDGGDDSIWGILDLAEMIEKGNIPGLKGSSNSQQASPQGGATQKRLVVPRFHRPSPPRSYGEGGHNPNNDGPPSGGPDAAPHHPPPIPPGSSQRGGFPGEGVGAHANDGGFDYDDHPDGASGRPPSASFDSTLDSHEGTDYGDDLYKK